MLSAPLSSFWSDLTSRYKTKFKGGVVRTPGRWERRRPRPPQLYLMQLRGDPEGEEEASVITPTANMPFKRTLLLNNSPYQRLVPALQLFF